MKKNLISAIKKLLAKLGAEDIEGNNLVEIIDSGADAIEGGGSSEPFVVTFTAGTHNTVTSDKTHAEIIANIEAKRPINAILIQPDITKQSNIYWYDGDSENGINDNYLFFNNLDNAQRVLWESRSNEYLIENI